MGEDRKRKVPRWKFTRVPNLLKNTESGIYYARPRVGGKFVYRSLKTKRWAVAVARHAGVMEQVLAARRERQAGGVAAGVDAAVSLGDFVALQEQAIRRMPGLAAASRERRLRSLRLVQKSMPVDLLARAVHRVSAGDVRAWAVALEEQGVGWRPPGSKAAPRAGVSVSSWNKAVAELRAVFRLAAEAGLVVGDPCAGLAARRPAHRLPELPDAVQFARLRDELRLFKRDPWELVSLLAFTGMRLAEAARVTVGDARAAVRDGRLAVRGSKSAASRRWVPVFAQLRELLVDMLEDRQGERARSDAPLLRARGCQGALDRACAAVGIPRLTHHDFRHWFATRVIESGVDIPTLSRWLGHGDGGALAMRVYGHLRDAHSQAAAERVQF